MIAAHKVLIVYLKKLLKKWRIAEKQNAQLIKKLESLIDELEKQG